MSSQINGDATGITQGHCNEAGREKGLQTARLRNHIADESGLSTFAV
jgi:hypothetical protein